MLGLLPSSTSACSLPRPVQLRRYDLVIQLSEEGAALGARGMRNSSRDTLRDLECDMGLATALAQVNGRSVSVLRLEGKPFCAPF